MSNEMEKIIPSIPATLVPPRESHGSLIPHDLGFTRKLSCHPLSSRGRPVRRLRWCSDDLRVCAVPPRRTPDEAHTASKWSSLWRIRFPSPHFHAVSAQPNADLSARAREPEGQVTLAQRSARFKTNAVRVARQDLPPLSGFIHSCRCVTSASTAQSSRSKVVPGGLKLYLTAQLTVGLSAIVRHRQPEFLRATDFWFLDFHNSLVNDLGVSNARISVCSPGSAATQRLPPALAGYRRHARWDVLGPQRSPARRQWPQCPFPLVREPDRLGRTLTMRFRSMTPP